MRQTAPAVLVAALALAIAGAAPAASHRAADSGEGPVLVKDICPDTFDGVQDWFIPKNFVSSANGTLYFTAPYCSDEGGVSLGELWRSDGTNTGTTFVDGPQFDTTVADVLAVGDTIFFSRVNNWDWEPYHWELWKSDGTDAGTTMLKAFPTVAVNTGQFTRVGTTLFFVVTDSDSSALWKSDGTEAGTVMVKEIGQTPHSGPSDLKAVGDTLFFDGPGGFWRSDGTADGTMVVASTSLGRATLVGDTFFFVGNDGVHGQELWKSDGTDAGTTMVKDINPGFLPSVPAYITDFGGVAIFRASDRAGDDGLWRSDGTEAGTTMIKKVAPSVGCPPWSADYATANGTLYFAGDDGVNGVELWRTDGTPDGTTMVKEIRPGFDGLSPRSSDPCDLTDVSGTIYFIADDGVHGRQLWRSDGTDASTTMVEDVNPPSYLYPQSLSAVGGTLFFVAYDGAAYSPELWKTSPPNVAIAAFTPTRGLVGTAVTVRGTGMNEPTAVTLNGTNATIASASPTSVKFSVPQGASSGKIAVTTRRGTATSADTFSVIARPTITGFTPISAGIHATVTVTGTDLDVATTVTLGGMPVPFAAVSPTRLTFTVPSGAAGGAITVTTPAGTRTTTTSFTVLPPPTITGFSPASGPVGTTVTVTGTNLVGTVGVMIGHIVTVPISVNDNQIVFTVPPGASTGTITILNEAGAAKGGTFTVTG